MSNTLWRYGLQPARQLCPWDSPGKNTGVGCHFLLLGIFPAQGSNPHLSRLLHWRRILSHWVTRELILPATIRKLERVKSIINCNISYVMIYNIYWTLKRVSGTMSIIIYKYYIIQSSSQLDNPQYRNKKSEARRNWEACPGMHTEWRRQVLNWPQSPYSYKLYFPLCYLVDVLRKLLILHRTFI